MALFRRFTVFVIFSVLLLVVTFNVLNRKTAKDTSTDNCVTDSTAVSPFLIVLFTTVKEIGMIPHHQFAFNAVLTNWPSFKPYIQPVVFLNFTNSPLAKRATDAGWDVLPLTRTNKYGTPFLKAMYRTVFDKYNAMLYGYANGDLLFDDGLPKTLKAVEKEMAALSNNVLVIGSRTNVEVDLKNVSLDEFRKDRLQDLKDKKGQVARYDFVDYFFFSKEGCSLNWSSLANVVIGRFAYDSYMVAMSNRDKVNIIDATDTLLAIHVSENGVWSHGVRNSDSRYNRAIMEKFQFVNGRVTSAGMKTREDGFGNIVLMSNNNRTLKSLSRVQKKSG